MSIVEGDERYTDSGESIKKFTLPPYHSLVSNVYAI